MYCSFKARWLVCENVKSDQNNCTIVGRQLFATVVRRNVLRVIRSLHRIGRPLASSPAAGMLGQVPRWFLSPETNTEGVLVTDLGKPMGKGLLSSFKVLSVVRGN